jgi:hypothetical protein
VREREGERRWKREYGRERVGDREVEYVVRGIAHLVIMKYITSAASAATWSSMRVKRENESENERMIEWDKEKEKDKLKGEDNQTDKEWRSVLLSDQHR